jgi:transposase-like protein
VNDRLDRKQRRLWSCPRNGIRPKRSFQYPRTVELETGKGLAVLDACRKLGITEQTYYRWKKEYGGLRVDQAKRLKGLEQENLRLKRIVADQALDLSILKEVASGNF